MSRVGEWKMQLDDEKAQEYLMDATDEYELSNCCGAPILMETFCKDCKENCK